MSRPLTSVDPTADPEPTTKKRKIASTSDSQTTTDVVTTSETKSPSRKEYSVAEASVQTSLPNADPDISSPLGASDTSHHEVSTSLFEEVLLRDDKLKDLEEAVEVVLNNSSFYYAVQQLGQLVPSEDDSDSSSEQASSPSVTTLKNIFDMIYQVIPSTSFQRAPYAMKCADSSLFSNTPGSRLPPSVAVVLHSKESEGDEMYGYRDVAFLLDPRGADFEHHVEGSVGSSEHSRGTSEPGDEDSNASDGPHDRSTRYIVRPPSNLSRCAKEAMSALGNRRHVLGISFAGNHARFWYLDRAGSIRTPKMNMHEAPFVKMVIQLFLGSSLQLGYEECIVPKDASRPPTFDGSGGFTIAVQGVRFLIQRIVHVAHELSGRGTVILAATPEESISHTSKSPTSPLSTLTLPGDVVVKLSWQRVEWGSEDELYRLAQRKGVKGVARLYHSQVLARLSKGYRGRMLPLGFYRDRELRAQVTGPLCIPLHDVRDPETFRQAFISLVEGANSHIHPIFLKAEFLDCIAHHDLYELAGILHHDISVNNLMVDAKDNSTGILIDLDIAVRVRDGVTKLAFPPAPGGTYAFRAADILEQGEPVTKLFYRHDLESFLYTLMWIVRYYSTTPKDGQSLYDLEKSFHQPKGVLAAELKLGMMATRLTGIPDWPATRHWIPKLAKLFYNSQNDYLADSEDDVENDEESYGGRLTFDAFMSILKNS